MFTIKIFCYHPYDKFKPIVIGRSGKTVQELLEWAGRKAMPIILKRSLYNDGQIDILLTSPSKEKILERSFEF